MCTPYWSLASLHSSHARIGAFTVVEFEICVKFSLPPTPHTDIIEIQHRRCLFTSCIYEHEFHFEFQFAHFYTQLAPMVSLFNLHFQLEPARRHKQCMCRNEFWNVKMTRENRELDDVNCCLFQHSKFKASIEREMEISILVNTLDVSGSLPSSRPSFHFSDLIEVKIFTK